MPTCPQHPHKELTLSPDGKTYYCAIPHGDDPQKPGKKLWYRVPAVVPAAVVPAPAVPARTTPAPIQAPRQESGIMFALEAAARVFQGTGAASDIVTAYATDIYFRFIIPGLAGKLQAAPTGWEPTDSGGQNP